MASLAAVFHFQTDTDAGDLASDWRLYTYAPSTTTHKNVYTDSAGLTPHTYTSDGLGGQYIALNSRGELPADLYLASGGYTFVLKTDAGVTKWTRYAVGVEDLGEDAADTLRADLANVLLATKGAALVGYDPSLAYAAGTVGAKLREEYSVWDELSTAQIADVKDRTAALDVTAPFQAALDTRDTATLGGFQLEVPDGKYSITNTGDRILEIQDQTKLHGSSLEGTFITVAASSSATAVIEDDGSAAKLEIEDITIYGADNTALTSGIRLGQRTTQFGTYGSMDNVMVRDMPNAYAYNIDGNAIALGRLYSMNTDSGFISDAGGSGVHIESLWPLGFEGIGYQQAKGDHVNYIECEGPTADTAIPIRGERDLNIGSFYLSVGSGRQLRTPIIVNPTYVDDFYVGKTTLTFADSTALIGDTTNPDDSGTFDADTANTATDTAKAWQVDEWRGAYLHITGGTGSGQAPKEILSNGRQTLTVAGTFSPALDGTSEYKVSHFIRKSTDGGSTFSGGFGFSASLTSYWPCFYKLSVTDDLRAEAVVSCLDATPEPAPTISSATTIAPTSRIVFVSGTTTIQTITAPSPVSSAGGTITIIPTGAFSTGTSGNIAIASTAVVSKALHMTYDATTAKWYPSY